MFARLSLAHQFLLVSLAILLTGMFVIGTWVGEEIENGVINRTGAITALYVDSFVSPHLQDMARTHELGPEHVAVLDALMRTTPLGQRIVAFKVWGADGRILYSTNPALIGRQFQVSPRLARTFAGEVHSEISDLDEPENLYERGRWSELIETYAPVRAEASGSILAVSEFYQTTEDLRTEIRDARVSSWLVVGAATLAMYLLLAGLVGRASRTIVAQQGALRENVAQLTRLLSENRSLHDRVRRAAAHTTALNERYLRRVSADLHDGPGQDLSLALLRIDALAEAASAVSGDSASHRGTEEDFRRVRGALQSALAELRAISAGLRLPELGNLGLVETAQRAVREYERKTGVAVSLKAADLPVDAPLPAKITLYRLLQEALNNGFRHAGGAGQAVRIACGDHRLEVEVRDSGPGFDPMAAREEGHLGLAVMRERVEVLGGKFAVETEPGRGTRVLAEIPLEWLPGESE